MRRINLYITAQQDQRLRQSRIKTGLSVAELVRRAIDRTYPQDSKQRKAIQ